MTILLTNGAAAEATVEGETALRLSDREPRKASSHADVMHAQESIGGD
jgi:hypothetical protein